MHIKILCIGKTSEQYIKDAIDVYLKRLRHFCQIELIELQEIKNSSQKKEVILKKEADLLQKYLTEKALVVLLDEIGTHYNSTDFARFIEKKQNTGQKMLYFVIGGAYGFSDNFKKQYPERISLSKMTFTHQMVRLFFTEQIYRAYTIINNIPYHN